MPMPRAGSAFASRKLSSCRLKTPRYLDLSSHPGVSSLMMQLRLPRNTTNLTYRAVYKLLLRHKQHKTAGREELAGLFHFAEAKHPASPSAHPPAAAARRAPLAELAFTRQGCHKQEHVFFFSLRTLFMRVFFIIGPNRFKQSFFPCTRRRSANQKN